MDIELGVFGIGTTVLINIFGTIWWAGNMNSRVNNLETEMGKVATLPERIARLEANTQTLIATSQSTEVAIHTVKDILIAQGHAENNRLKQLEESRHHASD